MPSPYMKQLSFDANTLLIYADLQKYSYKIPFYGLFLKKSNVYIFFFKKLKF